MMGSTSMEHSHQSPNNYKVIWDTVRQIPKGRVATYGEIADVNGLAGQARVVGYALHNIPPNSKIPWHRVVNAQGKISFPKGSHNHTMQRKLLQKEGIVFRGEKIDLVKYNWLRQLKNKIG